MSPPKFVLITDCSEGGIGFALAWDSWPACLCHTRSLAKLTPLKSLPNVTLLSLDLTSDTSVKAAVFTVSAETDGKLDYLVNNSGSQYVMPLLEANVEMSKVMFEVNVWGVVRTVQAFAPLVIAARGSIINIGSMAGLMYPPYMVLYAASKAAIHTLSEGLRLELKPFSVKVMTVIAGSVETNLFANAPEHHLPEGSRHAVVEKEVAARATETDVGAGGSKEEDYARD